MQPPTTYTTTHGETLAAEVGAAVVALLGPDWDALPDYDHGHIILSWARNTDPTPTTVAELARAEGLVLAALHLHGLRATTDGVGIVAIGDVVTLHITAVDALKGWREVSA